MKRANFYPEQDSKEMTENAGIDEKEEISATVKDFFEKFAGNYHKPEQSAEKEKEEKTWLAEIVQLDENTAPEPKIQQETSEEDISPEEFHQLKENDPGYVNEMVLDYDNILQNPNNTYKESGEHKNAIYWGDYAVENSVKYHMLQPGMVLSRWGNENGTFMANVNTDYHSLELPIVREKQTQNLYEVCKPFPVEISQVAIQPWNKMQKNHYKPAVQYKLPTSVEKLLNEGYLKLSEK